jgi:antitoxin VapB
MQNILENLEYTQHRVYKGISMTTAISRVFMNGNSQAVRIPQEFRLDSSRVEIYRNTDGDLVLHPIPADRGAALLQALEAFDDDFADLLLADQQDPLELQDREPL